MVIRPLSTLLFQFFYPIGQQGHVPLPMVQAFTWLPMVTGFLLLITPLFWRGFGSYSTLLARLKADGSKTNMGVGLAVFAALMWVVICLLASRAMSAPEIPGLLDTRRFPDFSLGLRLLQLLLFGVSTAVGYLVLASATRLDDRLKFIFGFFLLNAASILLAPLTNGIQIAINISSVLEVLGVCLIISGLVQVTQRSLLPVFTFIGLQLLSQCFTLPYYGPGKALGLILAGAVVWGVAFMQSSSKAQYPLAE